MDFRALWDQLCLPNMGDKYRCICERKAAKADSTWLNSREFGTVMFSSDSTKFSRQNCELRTMSRMSLKMKDTD